MEDLTSSDFQNTPRKGKELFLDTKGACFLCLSESVVMTETGKEGIMTEVCLRNICRYLNINPCAILLKSLNGTLLSEEDAISAQNKDKCDFSVSLCLACSSLTKKLSALIRETEIAKMLMNQNLNKFYQILVATSGQDPKSRWRKLQEKMLSSSDNPVESRLVEQLRHETKQKCGAKVKRLKSTNLPRVRLKRLATHPKDNDDQQVSQQSSEKIPEVEASLVTAEKMGAPSNTVTTFLSEIVDNHRQKDPRGSVFKCPYCNSRSRNNTNASKHLISTHPEKCFAHKKLQQISDTNFMVFCKRILEKTSSDPGIESLDSTSDRNEHTFPCEFCNEKFSNPSDFKHHLVLEHVKMLEEKLLQLQKESFGQNNASTPHEYRGVKRILKFAKPVMKLVSTIFANFCEREYREKGNLYRCLLCKDFKNWYSTSITLKHMANKHPEKFFPHIKSHLGLSEDEFTGRCKQIIVAELRLAQAKCRSKSRALSREVVCLFCNVRNSDGYNLKYHLVMQHYNIIERKLGYHPDLQQEDTPKVMTEETETSTETRKRTGKTLACKFNVIMEDKPCIKNTPVKTAAKVRQPGSSSRNVWTCSATAGGCGKKFASRDNLRRHKKEYCPKRKKVNFWVCSSENGGCGQSYSTGFGLRRHQRYHCRTKNPSKPHRNMGPNKPGVFKDPLGGGEEELMQRDSNSNLYAPLQLQSQSVPLAYEEMDSVEQDEVSPYEVEREVPPGTFGNGFNIVEEDEDEEEMCSFEPVIVSTEPGGDTKPTILVVTTVGKTENVAHF